jgi:hypothetical protein
MALFYSIVRLSIRRFLFSFVSDAIHSYRCTAMVKGVSRRPVVKESRVKSLVNPRMICGGQRGTYRVSPSTWFCPFHYHPTKTLHPFIDPQSCISIASNGVFNPLTPELNLSAQRRLTRFFTGDFAS